MLIVYLDLANLTVRGTERRWMSVGGFLLQSRLGLNHPNLVHISGHCLSRLCGTEFPLSVHTFSKKLPSLGWPDVCLCLFSSECTGKPRNADPMLWWWQSVFQAQPIEHTFCDIYGVSVADIDWQALPVWAWTQCTFRVYSQDGRDQKKWQNVVP